jgi:hypothetical protein
MNNESPTGNADADAPVPLAGTEHAADQAAKQQQPPPPESSVLDTVGNVIEGIIDIADTSSDILDIFS